ncbi:hypothetical protein [Aquimarina sediminis]|uniref:hypothetical protein n=1 Tax=Aquimarina sediminis TaxID=2070536 RepID=UPI000CA06BBC|nr:hypothetical protein [Aquimarina sediminis]
MKSNSKKYKIWFYSKRPLNDLAETFFEKGLIREFEYNYENVYEWIEAQSTDQSVELNISRKHSYLEGFEKGREDQLKSNLEEPITLMLMYDNVEPSDSKIETIAYQINLVLATKVYLGLVKYLEDDDYEYLKMKEIT